MTDRKRSYGGPRHGEIQAEVSIRPTERSKTTLTRDQTHLAKAAGRFVKKAFAGTGPSEFLTSASIGEIADRLGPAGTNTNDHDVLYAYLMEATDADIAKAAAACVRFEAARSHALAGAGPEARQRLVEALVQFMTERRQVAPSHFFHAPALAALPRWRQPRSLRGKSDSGPLAAGGARGARCTLRGERAAERGTRPRCGLLQQPCG